MTLPTSQKVEIEWDGVSFTDVSDYVDNQRSGPEARFGRMSPTGDVESATFTCVLDNRDGRFTPGNPAGAYWPNVKTGPRIRWKVTGGDAVERTEFVGYIQGFEPDFVDGGVSGAVVTVTASDRLAITNRVMDDPGVERARFDAVDNSKVFDAWVFTDRPGATSLVNVGNSASKQPGLVVYPNKNGDGTDLDGGTATLTTPDQGLLASGSMSLEPISEVGPVLELPVSCPTVGSVQFWFRTTEIPLAAMTLAQGFDSTGEMLWKVYLSPSGSQVNLARTDGAGTTTDVWAYGVNDGYWRHVWFDVFSATDSECWSATLTDAASNTYHSVGGGGSGTAVDMDTTKTIIIGGAMVPVSGRGMQRQCPTVEIAQVVVTENEISGGVASYASPIRYRLSSVWLPRFSEWIFADAAAVTINGSADPSVALPNVAGSSGTQVLQEVARTVGGVSWIKPDGTVEFREPDSLRPGTPDLTIDAEADAEGAFTLVTSVSTRPTRVSVASPVGDVQVVSATEGTTVVEESIDTCAATVNQARNAGELLLQGTDELRITGITLNLATAQTSLWTDVYDLYPQARVRVSGLPSAVLGVSYADYWVSGWTKRAAATVDGSEDGFWVELDLEPAWTIAEVATARTAAATGAMTATAGSISGTSTGTLVVTTGSGPALSNDAGDYPCDFNWNGERVTVTSAPASASSPQTLTVTARGVAPSVARTHGAGEAFGVWNPGKVGI